MTNLPYHSPFPDERRRILRLNRKPAPVSFWLGLAGGIAFMLSLWTLVYLLNGGL